MGIEERFEEVRQLIAVGKERGYLVHDEIYDLLPDGLTSTEDIDELFRINRQLTFDKDLNVNVLQFHAWAISRGRVVCERKVSVNEKCRERKVSSRCNRQQAEFRRGVLRGRGFTPQFVVTTVTRFDKQLSFFNRMVS